MWKTRTEVIILPIVKRIEGGAGPGGWSDHKPDTVEPDNIAGDIALGLAKKCRTTTIHNQGITYQYGSGVIADHDGFEKTSRNDVSL